MTNFGLTAEQITAYKKDGYLIVPDFLSSAETQKLATIAIGDDAMNLHAFDLNDRKSGTMR